MKRPYLALLTALAILMGAIEGCAGSYQDHAESTGSRAIEKAQSSADAVSAITPNVAQTGQADPLSSSSATGGATAETRKIIYDSTVDLVVDDYNEFESSLPAMVARYGGFVARSDTDRRHNDRQSGTWRIRIPVASYTAFRSGVTSLGFAESISENAQDVTEEYVDVVARVENKRKLETRIVSLLEERPGKLADVLEIERELSRVREEIERMEGRLRLLNDRTSLATITIRCREQQAYQPPAAPTFVSRIYNSGADSLRLLRAAAEQIAIVLTALSPWLAVVGIPLLLIRKWLARRWEQSTANN